MTAPDQLAQQENEMSDTKLVDELSRYMADEIGHGMREKTDRFAELAVAFFSTRAEAKVGWRSISTAPQDMHVLLSTTGGHVGEALMLIDEDTGQQKWTWALGPVHPNHVPLGWMHIPDGLPDPIAQNGEKS